MVSSVAWDYKDYPVTQPFGVYSPEHADWYAYAADYGWRAGTHIGLDVKLPKFTPVKAVQSGRVEAAGWSDSFRPNPVRIIEDDGDEAIYGHLWSAAVAPNQRVKRGQLLGYSGEQTVRGTMIPDGSGPHIHFELRRPDPVTGGYVAVDPTPELTGGVDRQDPAGQYQKSPVEQYGNWLNGADDPSSGLGRVILGTAGMIVALTGVWLLLGAPTSLAGIAKNAVGG